MSQADTEENPRGKMDLDLDLVRKLENFPLRDFLQLYNSELTQYTIHTLTIAGKLKADLSRLIRIIQSPENIKKNEQLYKFIQDECDKKRMSCSDLLKVLKITKNQKVLDFIKSKVNNHCNFQHQSQSNSLFSSNQNQNTNDINIHENVDGQNQFHRISFNVLNPVEPFHGQKNFLEKLHKTIQCGRNEIIVVSQANPTPNLTNQFCSGSDGIGKTETTHQYIFLYGQFYNNVIWIDAGSRFTLENSFLKLALELKVAIENPVDGKPLEMKQIVRNVYKKLCEISQAQPEKQLIIFDNADFYQKYQNQNKTATFSTFSSNMKSESETASSVSYKNQGALTVDSFLPSIFLPTTENRPRVLITSQNKNWSSSLGKIQILELNTLNKNEGAEFILNQLGIEGTLTNLHGATTLAFLLAGHPLALKLASYYLKIYNAETLKTGQKNSRCLLQSIYVFIEKCKKTATILKANPNPSERTSPQSSSYFPTGIQITWTIIMEKLEKVPHGILAMKMNEMLTFLYAENIPVNFLFTFLPKSEVVEVEKSLKLLQNYGIIDIFERVSVDSSESSHFIKIPRILQSLTLESMKKSSGNIKIQEILKTLQKKYRFILEYLNNFEIHDPIFLSIHQLLIDDPLDLAAETSKFPNLNLMYARFLRQKQKYEESLELLKMMETNFDENFPSQPNIFEIQMEIALVLSFQEKYDEALVLYESIEKAQKEHPNFGLAHPKTISTKFQKSVTLRKQGNYSRALQEIEQVVELRRKILGPFLLNTLSAEQEMAYMSDHSICLVLKNYDILYEKQCQLFGENDSCPVHLKFFEAWCLLKLEKFPESLLAFRELHKILVFGCRFGENHPESLNVEMYMMLILEKQGEFEECRKILQKVYQQQLILLGENHEETKNASEWLFYVKEKLENQMQKM